LLRELWLPPLDNTARFWQEAEQMVKTGQAVTRRARVRLAVDLYAVRTGKRPRDIADLVPEYLREAPIDPTTGTRMELPQESARDAAPQP
jgi:hypothetical protein